MSLPRIRLELCRVSGDGLWLLDREQERHLVRALRVYEGALVEGLLPGEESDQRLILRLEKTAEGMALREAGCLEDEPEGVRIHLLIGLLKSEQFDAVLRMAAEVGLFSVRPVVCARSVPRIADSELPKKMRRWRKILDEGSKVSGFIRPPRMATPVPFAGVAWASLPRVRYAAVLTAQATPLSKLPSVPDELVFAVGPEGDWSPEETSALLDNSFAPVGLGRGILRASTAAAVGCGWFRLMSE